MNVQIEAKLASSTVSDGSQLDLYGTEFACRVYRQKLFCIVSVIYKARSCKIPPIKLESDKTERCALDKCQATTCPLVKAGPQLLFVGPVVKNALYIFKGL